MPFNSIFSANSFSGQTIVVTGGGSGIGRCIAHELASLGAQLILFGRDETKLKTVCEEIKADGGKADFRSGDIRDADSVRENIASCIAEHGPIHGLVNNAGGQFPARLEDISPNGFLAVLKNNLLGSFIVSSEVYKQSMQQHGGAMVNITADYFGGMPRMGHSGAARAGVENMSQTAAVEWARNGVRINTIAPGYIASSGMDSYEDPEMIRRIPKFHESVPLGRMGSESEVSSAVVFLLSPAAAYITGTTLRIDGGSSLCVASPLADLEIATRNNETYNSFHLAETPKILQK